MNFVGLQVWCRVERGDCLYSLGNYRRLRLLKPPSFVESKQIYPHHLAITGMKLRHPTFGLDMILPRHVAMGEANFRTT